MEKKINKNYTIIYQSVVYELDDVQYTSSSTHRRFKRNNELVLSIPLDSVLFLRKPGIEIKMTLLENQIK